MSTAPVEPRALAVVPEGGSLASMAMAIRDIVEQKQLIAQVMRELMKKDEHYGVIPGTGKRKDADGNELPPKPSLYKPGADLLGVVFRLDPEYTVEECVHEPGYIYYRIKCTLTHIPTGLRVGSGMGSCNSREEKYRRAAPKKCPSCGKEAIKRSKFPPRDRPKDPPGWYCHDKAAGCGANFAHDASAITEQDAGIADPSDLDNTILKTGLKRARVDAVLTTTAASDFFTQDVEDLAAKAAAYTDVEVTPVDPKGEAAASSHHTATASTTATRTAGPTSAAKPPAAPRANTVQHDGTFASPDQVRLLHALRSKVGGLVVCSDKAPCSPPKSCAYHKQLAGFKDVDGKPIATSTDLSEAQIENLIGRYRAQINRQAERAQQEPDIGAVIPEAPQGKISASNTSTIHGYLHKQGMTELELCSIFGCDSVAELTDDQVASALAIVMAYGTSNYERVLAKVQQQTGGNDHAS